MNRRQFLAQGAAAAAGWALFAAGCGSVPASGSSGGGTITVYGALTSANGKALKNGFEKAKPGTTVEMLTSGTGKLLSRIESERRAGRVHANVIMLADPTAMAGLRAQGLLTAVKVQGAAKLPSGFTGADWFAPYSFNNLILYHHGAPVPAPADWKDLIHPVYSGHQELGNPAYSGTTLAMAGVLSEQYGWSYFQQLAKQGALVVQSTHTVGVDVAAGRRLVGISLDAVGRPLVKQGSPIEMIYPASGTVSVPAPVAVVKGNSSADAVAFCEWLLTAEAQATLGKLGLTPALAPSSGASAPTRHLPVDWARILKDRQTILSRFNSTFGL